MQILYEALFLAVIIAIADYQAHRISNGHSINHWQWGIVWGILIGGAWWLEQLAPWFLLALLLEHFVFFAPLLNFYRKPRQPFFYIHSVGKGGSGWDFILQKTGKLYPFIWIAGVLAYCYTQFKLT